MEQIGWMAFGAMIALVIVRIVGWWKQVDEKEEKEEGMHD